MTLDPGSAIALRLLQTGLRWNVVTEVLQRRSWEKQSVNDGRLAATDVIIGGLSSRLSQELL